MVSVRPSAGNVVVFETYEGDNDEPAGISRAGTAADA